ncbi:unnamed protein product [Hymenolepis diminuta]|uniref:Uncharacterized protein n=1 Tax=Hymenolepis diminuta TaxID=6216 RepID=A0A564XXF8_HYMDI|nr:unnamed protein product [Hymenolepis diminuta]
MLLQGIDDIHSSDSLSLGVLSISGDVTNKILEENLQNTMGFFVDETGDTLYTTMSSKTSKSRLVNSSNIIAKDLPLHSAFSN